MTPKSIKGKKKRAALVIHNTAPLASASARQTVRNVLAFADRMVKKGEAQTAREALRLATAGLTDGSVMITNCYFK